MIPSLTNLLDILSHLLSGIYSDILSHVEKRVKISASMATTSTAISDLQRRRWPLYMRVCVCESIRMVQWLSQEYLTFFLAFYLASFLPFFLTFFLALCLTICSDILSGSLSGVLSGMCSDSALHSIAGGIAFGSKECSEEQHLCQNRPWQIGK